MLSVLETLVASGHNVNVHDEWFVIDSPTPTAFTLGDNLYITTKLIQSDYLAGVLAHELARLEQGDGRMLDALRSFTYPFIQYRMTKITLASGEVERAVDLNFQVIEFFGVRFTVFLNAVLFGGLGLLMYRREWAEYFRERAFLADENVVRLELSDDLVTYLEEIKDQHPAVPFSTNWVPYAELRMDRILQKTEREIYTTA